MQETYLRTWHRRFGISMALLVFLQTASGVLLTWEDYLPWHFLQVWASWLHRGGGVVGIMYRTVLGVFLMGMAISGSLIFFKVWRRTRRF